MISSLMPCCGGIKGGYSFGGFYEQTRELDEPVDVYLRQVMGLLYHYGARHTVRGNEDVGRFEAFGDVTVSLKWIMDPPGSTTLTYAQSREAVGYALEVIDGDIYSPQAADHELAMSISVGQDKKILFTVTHDDDGDGFQAEAGSALEITGQTYLSRPISRSGSAASLSAATAEYDQHRYAAVPAGFAQTFIRDGVQFKMLLGLGEGETHWPHFTFADLVDVANIIQSVLEETEAPSADSWGALYASIETQGMGFTVGFVHFEAVKPGVHLLTSDNSTQATISRMGNSSAVSQVNVT